MRNRDKSAHPAPSDAPDGLTKREAAAIAAMQGLMSNSDALTSLHQAADSECGEAEALVAKEAIRQADALFDELEKGGDDDQE